MMFEEINQKLDKSNLQIEKIGLKQPEITDNEKIAKLKSVMEIFHESRSEKLDEIGNAIQKEKRKIEFTPTSMQALIIIFSLLALLVTLSVWINSLRNQISDYSDNDLKYRYIQMLGQVMPEDLATIDTIFYFNRDSKRIKALRKQNRNF
ncbi:hypothetical protein [Proteiniphilum sp. X52]|uniref:hypothetical protein n=1 Tax=Proteiniphilum sp. X52 TaxID=2382159 RepID=UPI0011CEA935|nr:hypothetical protein [Proteiniphilum sp. X52]